MKIKKYLISFVITLSIAGLIFVLFEKWKSSVEPLERLTEIELQEKMEKVGLPEFESQDIDGNKVFFRKSSGKLILVNFWASWCGPCVEEFPSMIKLVEAMKGDLILIAISGDSNRSDIELFLKEQKGWRSPNIHIIWDNEMALSRLYDVDRLPESYLADKSGKLAKKIVGSINWHTPESVAYLQDLMRK